MSEVSVLLAVHKNRGYLSATIHSVLDQTFTDFDLIVIDDGSVDNTDNVLKWFSKADERVVIIKNRSNIGLTRSLHKGVKFSDSSYIARIDEGDIWLPEKLALQVEFLRFHPDHGMVGAQYRNLNRSGELKPGTKLPTSYKGVLRWLISGKNPITHPAIVFRSGLINYNKELSTSQDFELCSRIAILSKIANLNSVLLYVFRDIDAISTKNSHLQFYNHLVVHKQFIRVACGKIDGNAFAKRGADLSLRLPFQKLRQRYMKNINFSFSKLKRTSSIMLIEKIYLPDTFFYKMYCLIVFLKCSPVDTDLQNRQSRRKKSLCRLE